MIRHFPATKISLSALRKFLLSLVLIMTVFSSGFFIGRQTLRGEGKFRQKVTISRDLPENRQDLDFSLFWRVWDSLEASYFDKEKLVPAEMVYGAIKGMVASLGDPYTVFLTPKENRVVQEDLRGSFEGVGIQIGFRGTRLAVISPLSDSPAEKAGIKPGDLIINIRDQDKGVDLSTAGITLHQAVQAIRGESGSVVTLTLVRDGQDIPLEIDIRRETIDIPSIGYSLVGEDESIAHVRLIKFAGETFTEWDKIVREILKDPNIEGIIIDVRNNPGGFLEAAVDIASDFLENGSVVVTEENGQGKRTDHSVERVGRLGKYKLVILMNQGSASASEILAGALRDQLGTKLIGETTFGKGIIQEPQQVDSGAGLHLTIAKWLTPAGTWIDKTGLNPDIEVKDDPETSPDEQLEKAIEMIYSNN